MEDPMNFGVNLQESMGAGLRTPRADLYSNLPSMGVRGIQPSLADVEVERQQALNRIAGLGASTAPRIQPPPQSAMRPGPGIYYSPSTDRFSVGGVQFGRKEYDVALKSPSFMEQEAPPPGGDFRRISPVEYYGYLSSISEGRGIFGGLAVGARNVGEGLVGGTGRGLQMLGAEGAGQALVGIGEAIGLSDAERARSAAISARQGLAGKVGTAVVESVPTLGVSIAGGLAGAQAGAAFGAAGGPVGAAAGATIGSLIGIAATIFPMELQSSWEAAEENGLDPTDPNVQTDILLSSLFKTGVQSAGPAVITRGFSPALRRVVGDVSGRTLGQRFARGIGAGALEGSAEAIAQVTDRVVFDPELRAQLNEADIAALAPMVAQRHGEEILVAFLAGAAIAGPLGALGTPTQARTNADSGKPTNLLTGAQLDPQAAPGTQGELFGGADLGRRVAGLSTGQGELFPGQPLGVAPDQRQLDLFPAYSPPSQQPGYQMELPLQAAPVQPAAPAVQQELPFAEAPGTQTDLFGGPPIFPPGGGPPGGGFPAARAAPVQPAGYTGPQAEMFAPSEMGLPAATQALLNAQRIPFSTPPPRAAAPAPTQAELEAEGQGAFPLTFSFPPAQEAPSAMAAQLGQVRNRVLEQAAERARSAAAIEEEKTRLQQEFEAAKQQRGQQEADREPGGAGDIAWEQFRPETATVTFDILNKKAQDEWVNAVRDGTADEALYNKLRPQFDRLKARKRTEAANRSAARATREAEEAARAAEEAARAPSPPPPPAPAEPAPDAPSYYHGSPGKVEGALRPSLTGLYGPGVYLTTQPDTARKAYAGETGEVVETKISGQLATRDQWKDATKAASKGVKLGLNAQTEIDNKAIAALEAQGFVGVQGGDIVTVWKSENLRPVKKPTPRGAAQLKAKRPSPTPRGVKKGVVALNREAKREAAIQEAAASGKATPVSSKGTTDTKGRTIHEVALPSGEIVRIARTTGPKGVPGWFNIDNKKAGKLGDTKAQALETLSRQPPPTPPETGARRAAQEPSPTEMDARQQAEDGKGVGRRNAKGQAAPETRTEEAGPETKIVKGPGGRREILPAEPEAEAEPPPPPQPAADPEGPKAEDDLAFLEDAIVEVETATDDKVAVENLADVIAWSKDSSTTKAVRERAKAFLAAMEEDPATATQVRAARDLEKARRKDASVKPEDVLDANTDIQILIRTIQDLNTNNNFNITPRLREILRDAWNRIKNLNPQYAGEPLANFIDLQSTEFFNRGPRDKVTDIRPVVSKKTGRTKLSSYNQITNPIPMGKAKMVVSNFLSRLAIKPKVRMYRNVEEFQRKAPELFAQADAARPQGDFTTIQASGYSFGDGNVIIFTDNIINEAHLKAVLAHETLGHFGMRGLLPQAEFNALMDIIYERSEVIRSAADAAVEARGMSKAEAVEEYLADFAAVLDTSLIARIWATLKNALNKIGVKFGDDAARYLVTQARKYVRNGETSAVFDNAAIAQRLHSIESGQDPDGTGRFARANTLSGMGIVAGNLDGSTLPYTKEGLISTFRNIADFWDRLQADAFSLTNYRSKENPGLARFYKIIMTANRLSMRYKNEANEAMARYLNPSLNLGVTRLGDGVIRTQKETIDQMIYAAQRYAIAAFPPLRPDARRPPLIKVIDGEPVVNQERLEELRKQGRRTVEDFRKGFEYTVYDAVPMTEAKREELRTKRDAELAKAKTDAERKAIETDYKLQIDAVDYLQPRVERFPGVPGLTKNSIEWEEYVTAREQVEKVEVELLRAHYAAHLKVVDNQFLEINEAMDNRMTTQDRQFLLRMNEKYREIYSTNLTVNEDGQIIIDPKSMEDADAFVASVNAALIATRGSDRNAAVFEKFDKADHDDINIRIEGFKTRFSPTEDQKFVVQNKLKEIVVDEISRNDNGFFAERTIGTGYTPVLREGRIQVRMVAVDPDTGKMLKMKDTFQQQLSYHQVSSVGEAAVLRDRINELFGDTTHEVAVWDSAARAYTIKKVKLVARAEQAPDAIAAPPQLNLNEFIIGLRRFSINLSPNKMEEVVKTLTRQNSRARNRLQRTFQPGADTDAAKAISGHIESRASTIAKTMMRPDLDRLMNMKLEETRRLWGASDEAKLARLKANYEAAMADPNATPAKKIEAKMAYGQYVYQRKNTLREDKDGVGMTQRYYTEAARALSFMESQKNLDESDLGSGDLVSRIRAATSMMQLGASPATAALNLISLLTNTLPYLASYNDKTAFGGGFGFGASQAAMFKALQQVGAPGTLDAQKNTATYYRSLAANPGALRKVGLTSDEALFLAREIEEGVAIPALSNSLIASARGRLTNAASQKFVDGWMVFFNRTEQSARRAALLAAYRLQYDRSIQGGKDPEVAMREARQFAVKTAEDTLGEYSVMNRPALWRGGPQQFLYMYKIFPTMSIQLLANLPRSGQLIMLGGLLALSGLAGLPFAEDIEDLVDTISAGLDLKTPSLRLEIAKAIDSVMPGWSPKLINGYVNALVPGDVGGRTSLGDFFPGTSIFLPGADVGRELTSIAGPVAGMLQASVATAAGLGQWAAYTAGISGGPTSLEGVARNAPVTMVRAWADAYAYTQSGAIVDRRGYIVSDEMSAMDVMARALGFYPTAAAEDYGIIRVSQRVANAQRDIAATFYNAYVQARLRGDTTQANQVLREVREWNREAKGTGLEISNFEKNAIRRLRDARSTALERTTLYAPKAAREQYEEAATLLGY